MNDTPYWWNHWDQAAETEQGAWDAVFSEPGVAEHTERDVDIICTMLGDHLTMMPLVEIGCGVGRLTSNVQNRTLREVIGFDPTAGMIAWANARNTNPYVHFEQGGVAALATHDRLFGGGYSMLTFQHLDPTMVSWYLEVLAAKLVPHSPFVLQFVAASDGPVESHSEWDHRYSISWVYETAMPHGLTCSEFFVDERHPEWVWTTLWRGWE